MKYNAVITGLDPDFPHHMAAEPEIGTKCFLRGGSPAVGRVTVDFIPTDLGYESNRDEDDRITLYLLASTVKAL